jgi:hypothetical protein
MDGPPASRRPTRTPGGAACALALAALLGLAAAPSRADEPPPEQAGPPAPRPHEESAPEDPCKEPGSDGTAIVDRMQRGVYYSVCGTAKWFDRLFGTRRADSDSDETFGRVGLTGRWNDRDGFDEKLRMRVRFALPAMEDRLKLFFGRADEREAIENQQASIAGGQVPTSFQRVEDESWLLGLGYSKNSRLENGFDFGAGIRIRTPVDPFAKGTYRHNWVFADDVAVRARQTVFWRDSRGWGETTEVAVDRLMTPRVLVRWDNSATLAEDVERIEWASSLTTFQSLGNRRGLAYTAFVGGVVNTDVPIRNYGAELRYRRQLLRKWLFLEARTSLSWPRETLAEDRKINPGVALGFEMYFGPVPDAEMR